MNKLTWFDYKDTEPDEFRIYRAIPGFQFNFNAIVTQNPVFMFSATSPDVQTLNLNATTIDTLVASLNKGKGIVANKTSNYQSIQVRLTAQSQQARLKIYACTFAEDIGIAPNTIIVPGLNFTRIAIVSNSFQDVPYQYTDYDGSYLDTYRLTSVTDGIETFPSFTQKPMLPGVSYCMAEARFTDIQGRPVRGIEVIAEPALLDGGDLSTNKIKVVSDSYGRVSIPLLQNHDYVLHIPAIGYNQYITVPEESFFDLTRWAASTKPEFTP